LSRRRGNAALTHAQLVGPPARRAHRTGQLHRNHPYIAADIRGHGVRNQRNASDSANPQ
jgi:hypothetical protein